jgi:mannan endo-1,4-beta-mannosidase
MKLMQKTCEHGKQRSLSAKSDLKPKLFQITIPISELLRMMLIALLLFPASSVLEAENATVVGATIESSLPDYSGSGYVYLRNAGESITWTFTTAQAGDYDLLVRYATAGGSKKQNLALNGAALGEIAFAGSDQFVVTVAAQKLPLKFGENVMVITPSWGWQLIDWIDFVPYVAVPFQIAPRPVTPDPTHAAVLLYEFLRSSFQKGVISGVMTLQGEASFIENDYVFSVTGHYPALVGLDFMHQVGKNSAWYVNDPVFRKCVVNDAEAYWKRGGIPALCWHWRDPLQDTDEFYSPSSGNNPTYFDASRAASPGTAEYFAVLRDMDVIAAELLDLQSRGVAALWRPFHEAAGGWFWWGYKGAEPVKKLWRLMYERFVNYHGIRNLIWVWTADASDDALDWFPGTDVVDIVGMDIYPAIGDHSAQSSSFVKMRTIFEGSKIIALSECGSIPDADEVQENSAWWSWFMPWYHQYTIPEGENPYNSYQFWKKQMSSEFVIGLDKMPGWE